MEGLTVLSSQVRVVDCTQTFAPHSVGVLFGNGNASPNVLHGHYIPHSGIGPFDQIWRYLLQPSFAPSCPSYTPSSVSH